MSQQQTYRRRYPPAPKSSFATFFGGAMGVFVAGLAVMGLAAVGLLVLAVVISKANG